MLLFWGFSSLKHLYVTGPDIMCSLRDHIGYRIKWKQHDLVLKLLKKYCLNYFFKLIYLSHLSILNSGQWRSRPQAVSLYNFASLPVTKYIVCCAAASTLFWEWIINSKLAQWQLNYPMALEIVIWNGSRENISIPLLPVHFRTYSINLCHCLHYVYLTKFCVSSVLEALISVPEFCTDVQFINRKTDVCFIHSLLNFQGNFWALKRNYSAVSCWFLHILITTVIFL